MTSWQVVKMALMRATTALVALTIIVPAVATPAGAAEFTHRPQANGPDIITMDGEIEPNDDKKFIEIARNIVHASVVLNSKGGSIRPAMNIGSFIRFHEYETRVHNGGMCNSACPLVWLAGTFRHLDRYARLGFHSAATTRRPPFKRSEPGNAIMALYMFGMGVPQQLIDLQPKADPCCANYIDHARAKAWGLLSDRLAKQQALRIPATRQQALPTLETQQSIATAPESRKAFTALPEPVPPQVLPIPQTPQPATFKKTSDRIDPGSQQAPVAQKVVLYEEEPDANSTRFVGSVIWRTETVTAGLGQPPELVVRAYVEVPERKLAVTWSLRRNTDKGLPATHTVEIMFKLPADFPFGGIFNVPGILMKEGERTRGVPLKGLAVKVTPSSYLIGLSNQVADNERNLQLLEERGWFDIPVVYNNNRRAILAMEKGPPGERVFANAFEVWKQLEAAMPVR